MNSYPFYSGSPASEAPSEAVTPNLLGFHPVPPEEGRGGQHSLMEGIDLASTVSMASNLTSPSSSASSTPFQFVSSQSSPAGGSKTKTPRKRKAQGVQGSQAITSSPASASIKKQNETIRNFVLNLMNAMDGGFADRDFAERALLNLARKLWQAAADGGGDRLEEWERAVAGRAPECCVRLARPRDGRMTVAKSSAASTKKVFPQIVICQMFRWPQIVFHNDIRSVPGCAHAAPVKPTQDGGGISSQEEAEPSICLNPFHYELSSEALNRFSKGKTVATANTSGVATVADAAAAKKKGGKKAKKKTGAMSGRQEHGKKSADEGFGDGEVHTFHSQGVDYLKIWEEKANDGGGGGGVQAFDHQEILKEIQFLSLDTCEKVSEKVLGKIGVKDLELLLSGELLKPELDLIAAARKKQPVKSEEESPECINVEAESAASTAGRGGAESSSDSEVEILPPPDAPKARTSPAKSKLLKKASSGGEGRASSPVEDSAIQDLLDDIRGSFERQFDDDFEELVAEESGGAEDDDFGIEPSLSMLDPDFDKVEGGSAQGQLDLQQEQQLPREEGQQQHFEYHHPHQSSSSHPHGPSMAAAAVPSSDQVGGGSDVPCTIVDSWSVPGQQQQQQQQLDEHATTDFLSAVPAPELRQQHDDQTYQDFFPVQQQQYHQHQNQPVYGMMDQMQSPYAMQQQQQQQQQSPYVQQDQPSYYQQGGQQNYHPQN